MTRADGVRITGLTESGTNGIHLARAAADDMGTGPASSGQGRLPVPAGQPRLVDNAGHGRPLRSWPLLFLALPATVAVWSGWVGIGRLTGFGEVHPLPGIWGSLHLDTAITLPIGVEAYAAYALRAWLSPAAASPRTRRFARRSAIGSLALGMAGQVAYHLLTQAHATRAPWGITTAVACLPVLVLGMGAALAHLIHADARSQGEPTEVSPADPESRAVHQDQDPANRSIGRTISPEQLAEAQAVAAQFGAAGQRVSRRSLRAAGLRGSNADLGALALVARADHLPHHGQVDGG